MSSENMKDDIAMEEKEEKAEKEEENGEEDDVIQEWYIAPNDTRTGVVTWTAPDGNILLRFTLHPEDKQIGVNTQVNKKFTKEEIFPLPDDQVTFCVTYRRSGFSIASILSVYKLKVIYKNAVVRSDSSIDSDQINSVAKGLTLASEEVKFFENIERYKVTYGFPPKTGWVSGRLRSFSTEQGDPVLEILSQSIPSPKPAPILLYNYKCNFQENIEEVSENKLELKLPSNWRLLPYQAIQSASTISNSLGTIMESNQKSPSIDSSSGDQLPSAPTGRRLTFGHPPSNSGTQLTSNSSSNVPLTAPNAKKKFTAKRKSGGKRMTSKSTISSSNPSISESSTDTAQETKSIKSEVSRTSKRLADMLEELLREKTQRNLPEEEYAKARSRLLMEYVSF